jgi:hypothetical protein
MLYTSNLMALVGGGGLPKYPNNRVVVFDDRDECVRAQIEFRAQVRAVSLRMGLIAAALDNRVFLYSWSGKPAKLGAFDTFHCSEGTCSRPSPS